MLHGTLTKSCILLYKRSGSALSVLLHLELDDVLTEDTPLKLNTLINKQIYLFDKNVSIVLLFFNYSSILSITTQPHVQFCNYLLDTLWLI